jgi:WXG100 family type VII secretion target
VTSIDVDFSAMSTESNELAQVASTMSERISAARSRVDELIGSGWSGAAASSFSKDVGAWATAADDAVAALRGLVEALRATAEQFAQNEQQAIGTSEQLASQLDALGIEQIMGGGR